MLSSSLPSASLQGLLATKAIVFSRYRLPYHLSGGAFSLARANGYVSDSIHYVFRTNHSLTFKV